MDHILQYNGSGVNSASLKTKVVSRFFKYTISNLPTMYVRPRVQLDPTASLSQSVITNYIKFLYITFQYQPVLIKCKEQGRSCQLRTRPGRGILCLSHSNLPNNREQRFWIRMDHRFPGERRLQLPTHPCAAVPPNRSHSEYWKRRLIVHTVWTDWHFSS